MNPTDEEDIYTSSRNSGRWFIVVALLLTFILVGSVIVKTEQDTVRACESWFKADTPEEVAELPSSISPSAEVYEEWSDAVDAARLEETDSGLYVVSANRVNIFCADKLYDDKER